MFKCWIKLYSNFIFVHNIYYFFRTLETIFFGSVYLWLWRARLLLENVYPFWFCCAFNYNKAAFILTLYRVILITDCNGLIVIYGFGLLNNLLLERTVAGECKQSIAIEFHSRVEICKKWFIKVKALSCSHQCICIGLD